MANILDLMEVVDVLISKSGASEVKINSAAVRSPAAYVEFFFSPLKDRRTGQVARKAQCITYNLDMKQEIDYRNPYYKRIAEEVSRIANQAITASTEPAPGADHQPPLPAP